MSFYDDMCEIATGIEMMNRKRGRRNKKITRQSINKIYNDLTFADFFNSLDSESKATNAAVLIENINEQESHVIDFVTINDTEYLFEEYNSYYELINDIRSNHRINSAKEKRIKALYECYRKSII